MDLLAIVRSLRRHVKIAGIVLAITGLAVAWLLLFMPRNYQAKSEFVLVNPAPAPTDAQIEKDPTLAQINRNNPYLRFANEGTVGHVLSGRMSGDSVREALQAQGADPDYTIAPSPTSGQVIDITGTGTSAQQAETTLRLVSERTLAELEAMQRVYGAQDVALIRALPVADPTGANVVLSGTIRMLVGILGAGVIVLFAAISIAEARRAGPKPNEQGVLSDGAAAAQPAPQVAAAPVMASPPPGPPPPAPAYAPPANPYRGAPTIQQAAVNPPQAGQRPGAPGRPGPGTAPPAPRRRPPLSTSRTPSTAASSGHPLAPRTTPRSG